MSKGHGKAQQFVLWALDEWERAQKSEPFISLPALAREYTETQYVGQRGGMAVEVAQQSLGRAIRRLEAEGLVARWGMAVPTLIDRDGKHHQFRRVTCVSRAEAKVTEQMRGRAMGQYLMVTGLVGDLALDA